jgi:hypothetical protein
MITRGRKISTCSSTTINNFAEWGFRKLVIARKISFGSQGDAGAETRKILMTTLLTLKKRKPGDVRASFKACLDELARDPKQDPSQVLFSLDGSWNSSPQPRGHHPRSSFAAATPRCVHR